MNNNPLDSIQIPDPVLENPPDPVLENPNTSNSIPEGMSFEDFVNQQLNSAAIGANEQEYEESPAQAPTRAPVQAPTQPPAQTLAQAPVPAPAPAPAQAQANTQAQPTLPTASPNQFASYSNGKKTMRNSNPDYIPNRITMPKKIEDAQNEIKKKSEKEFIENLLGYQAKTKPNKSNYWAARFYNENHPDSKQSIDANEWDLFKKDANYQARPKDKIDKSFNDFANHTVVSYYQNIALEAASRAVEKIDPKGDIFGEIVGQVNVNKKTISGDASEQVLFIAQAVINEKVTDKKMASQASHALITNYASLSNKTKNGGIDVPSNFANSVQNEKSLLDQLNIKIDNKDIQDKLEVTYGTLSSVEKMAVRNGLMALQSSKSDLNSNDIANNVKDVLLTINPKKGTDLTSELKAVMNPEPPKDVTAQASTEPPAQGGGKNTNYQRENSNEEEKKAEKEEKEEKEQEVDNKQKNKNRNRNSQGASMGDTGALSPSETMIQEQLVGLGVGIGRFIKEVGTGIGGGIGGFFGTGARSLIDGFNDRNLPRTQQPLEEQNQNSSQSAWEDIINDRPTSHLLNDTDKKIVKKIHDNFEQIVSLGDEMETNPTAENKDKLSKALVNHMNHCNDFMVENIDERGEKTEFLSSLAKDMGELNKKIAPIVSRYYSTDDPNNPHTVTKGFETISGLVDSFATNMTKLFNHLKSAVSMGSSNTNTSDNPSLPPPPPPRP